MNGKTKATDDLVFYVAHLIEDRQARGVDVRTIGKELGMSHATAIGICRDLKGIGAGKRDALAKALTGGSSDRLLADAAKWRAKHPTYLPRAYKEKNAAAVMPTRDSWSWWPALAQKATAKKPHLDWAIWAAGREPRGHEPRAEKRTAAYVVGLAETMLDLPGEEQQRLENEYRSLNPDVPRFPTRNTPSGMHGIARRQ